MHRSISCNIEPLIAENETGHRIYTKTLSGESILASRSHYMH
ncbi:Uncharacterised protein [Vibrio cholerae]|nr:Uncharacterised protein [Vibrio cholerae]